MTKPLSTVPAGSPTTTGRKAKLLYWVPTIMIALMMTGGGLSDALCSEQALEVMQRLGYPDYFTCLLGVAKLLGVGALLLPVPRVLREWAYAGFTFDVLGAAVSLLATGEAALGALAPLFAFGLILLSYRGWHKREPSPEAAARSAPQTHDTPPEAVAAPALIG